ncbi:hypothetical protein [Oceanobacillus sp. FSL W7-1281]|uniref:hypothetical protein n=1 Tax=Oceanobacillus TaxID=182709 RepID=UPI0030DC30E3
MVATAGVVATMGFEFFYENSARVQDSLDWVGQKVDWVGDKIGWAGEQFDNGLETVADWAGNVGEALQNNWGVINPFSW